MQTPQHNSYKYDSQSLGDPRHFCIQLQFIKTKLSFSTVKDVCSWHTNPGETPTAGLKTVSQLSLRTWSKHPHLDSDLLLEEAQLPLQLSK